MKAACVVIASILVAGCDRPAPTMDEMHRYRLSQLSDDELRAMHAEAVIEAKRLTEGAKRHAEELASRLEEKAAACRDPAYRARNDCAPGYIVPSMQAYYSPDEVFTSMINGPCVFARTWKDAIKRGCIAQE